MWVLHQKCARIGLFRFMRAFLVRNAHNQLSTSNIRPAAHSGGEYMYTLFRRMQMKPEGPRGLACTQRDNQGLRPADGI